MKTQGHTYQEIAAALAAKGYKGREDKPLAKSSLFNLLAKGGRKAAKHTDASSKRVKRGTGATARVKDRGKLEAIRVIVRMKAMDNDQKISVIESLL